jgi:LacI family transcriptional regulator
MGLQYFFSLLLIIAGQLSGDASSCAGMPPNLSELSVRLGVSVSTVSRALRNAEGVDSGTRARVLAEAARLGYRPPLRADRRGAERPRTLLALTRADAGALPSGVLAGLSRAAIEGNVSILTHQTPAGSAESILNPRLQPPALRSGMVDGLIFLQEWPRALVAELAQNRPAVSLWYGYPGLDHVGVEPSSGMNDLLAHLGPRGEELVGFFGHLPESEFSRRLVAAFQAALLLRGAPAGPVAAATEADLADLVLPACHRGIRHWICADAEAARLLETAAGRAGLQIPRDLGVAVFLHSPSPGARCWTSLTISETDLGVAAVRRLLHRLSNPDESVRHILLEARMSPGDSTLSPAPAAIP